MSDPEQAMQKTGGDGVPAQKGEVAATVDRHEKALLQNDLSKLSAEERKSLYWEICESTGLNPSTQPLEYIYLNGDLTLYANKTAAAQLRDNRGISITELEEEQKWGLFIVRAYAQTADGRTDVDEGSVALNGQSGEALANVRMKAITKAKRRVTLSISGMGFLDKTEVSDVPDRAKQAAKVDHETGEIVNNVSGKATGASTGTPSGDSTTPSKTSTETHQDGSSQATSDVESDDRSPTVKSRAYLQKARAAGDPQTLSDAIETVRGRADEKLDGDEAARVKRSTIVFEAIGHLRASVQGDFQSIDESVFNNALDWFAQQTDDWPGDELQWAQEVVHDEVQRIVAQVPGFEVEVVDEDGPFEVEGDAPEQSSAEQATEAMQNGETALDAGGDTQPEGTEPEDASEDEGEGSDSGASDTPDASDREYSGPEAAIRGHFEVAIRKGNLSEIPQEDQISGKQVKWMYAIANEEGWKDSWLDRMVKDELGYESKSVVPSGPAYEEIIDALESDEMRFWMSRDPDTGDLFEDA